MSIKKKILITTILATVFTSILTIILFSVSVSNNIEDNMSAQSNQIAGIVEREFNDIVHSIDQMNYLLIMDDDETFLKAVNQPQAEEDTFQRMNTNYELRKELAPIYSFQKYLSGLAVYSKTTPIVTFGENNDEFLESDSFIDAIKSNNEYAAKEIDGVFPIIRPVMQGTQQIGNTVAFINTGDFLNDQLQTLPENSVIEITNKKDNVLASTREKKNQSSNQSFYVRKTSIVNTGLTLKTYLPQAKLIGNMQRNLIYMILISLITLCLVIIISTIVCIKIIRNIDRLKDGMDQVKENNLNVEVAIDSKDELYEMGQTFNSMVGSIRNLIKVNKENEDDKKKIEIDFLQAQINPHFLSNTLNTITWMADLRDENNISKLSRSLVALLQSTMYKGEDFIAVEEEINHVKSYVAIEKVAYTDNFEVVYDIQPELLQERMLRFVLQPFIENSILHNFVDLELSQTGLIKINGYMEEDSIIFVIEDNGRGISKDDLEKRELSKKRYNNIGISNIDKRIKLYYGEGFGVTVESELGKFTKVIIHLSKVEGNYHAAN